MLPPGLLMRSTTALTCFVLNGLFNLFMGVIEHAFHDDALDMK